MIVALFDNLYAFTIFPLLMVCTVLEAMASGTSVNENTLKLGPSPVSERPNASVLNVRTQSSSEADWKESANEKENPFKTGNKE